MIRLILTSPVTSIAQSTCSEEWNRLNPSNTHHFLHHHFPKDVRHHGHVGHRGVCALDVLGGPIHLGGLTPRVSTSCGY